MIHSLSKGSAPTSSGAKHVADEGDGAGLRFAAPDAGDAGLAEPHPAGSSSHAHQDVIADEVLAERTDDGQLRADLTENGLGLHCGDRHGAASEGLFQLRLGGRSRRGQWGWRGLEAGRGDAVDRGTRAVGNGR